MMQREVSVIGLGYIGLPTAAVLASAGCRVVGVDVDANVIATINDGGVHIVEPGLHEVVSRSVASGNLRATRAPEQADTFIIAVPTPFRGDHEPDLSYIEAACKSIAPVIKTGDLVILESTSPVGTTELVAGWLSDARPDLVLPKAGPNERMVDIHVAYCPERVLPGNVLEELVGNDRVIGGLTPSCSAAAKALYAVFVRGECILTDARTAEMCKLTENSFRDLNIAFANELSLICDRLNVNVWELIALANHHPRVNILQPGPGVGGHCIAVDPWFLVHSSPEQARLIRTAREVNDGKPIWVIEQVIHAAASSPTQSDTKHVVACFGLAFKANIDDLRESPALRICSDLARLGQFEVLAVEPNIDTLPETLEGMAKLVDVQTALARADILLLLVDHTEFRRVKIPAGDGKVVIDTRGLWSNGQRSDDGLSNLAA